MDRRSFVSLGVLAAGAALVGCAPSWHVLAFASPNPFLGHRRFGVTPIDFAGLMVGAKPEPVYMAEKDAGQQASFQQDKAALNEKFLEHLTRRARENAIEVVPATHPGVAPFIVRPSVNFIEPGFYAGVAGAPSMVHMIVRIVAPDNRIFDEIALEHGTDPSTGISIGGFAIPKDPSSGGRLRTDGAELGELVGRYLAARVG